MTQAGNGGQGCGLRGSTIPGSRPGIWTQSGQPASLGKEAQAPLRSLPHVISGVEGLKGGDPQPSGRL